MSVLRTNGPLVVIYCHGGNLDHVTMTIYANFYSLFLRMLHMKFGLALIGKAVLEKKNILVIYMYIGPGRGRQHPGPKILSYA